MPKKGDVFFMSEGIYSDYHVGGHFIALKDFHMPTVSQDFLNTDLGREPILEYWDRSVSPIKRLPEPVLTDRTREIKHTTDSFQAYLLRNNYADNFEAREYWVGDYVFKGIKEE